MMAEIGEPFEKGEHVEVDLRGVGLIEGTVVWRTETRIGIEFAEPIDPRRARKSVGQRPAPPLPPTTVPAPVPRTTRRPKLFGE
jgi:hypothetical protein